MPDGDDDMYQEYSEYKYKTSQSSGQTQHYVSSGYSYDFRHRKFIPKSISLGSKLIEIHMRLTMPCRPKWPRFEYQSYNISNTSLSHSRNINSYGDTEKDIPAIIKCISCKQILLKIYFNESGSPPHEENCTSGLRLSTAGSTLGLGRGWHIEMRAQIISKEK